jgi:hypothetical protein
MKKHTFSSVEVRIYHGTCQKLARVLNQDSEEACKASRQGRRRLFNEFVAAKIQTRLCTEQNCQKWESFKIVDYDEELEVRNESDCGGGNDDCTSVDEGTMLLRREIQALPRPGPWLVQESILYVCPFLSEKAPRDGAR